MRRNSYLWMMLGLAHQSRIKLVCLDWKNEKLCFERPIYASTMMRSRVHISYLWLLIALRNKGCTRDDDHICVCLILTTMSEQQGF